MRKIIFAALAMPAMTYAAGAHAATVIVDQSNLGDATREFSNFFSLGQSFTPTATSISFASFQLRASGTAAITVQLYEGAGFSGALLGTSDAVTINTTLAMTQFTFAPITLTPGQLYTLRLSSSTGTFAARATENLYARGDYYNASGVPATAFIDLIFSEGYSSAVPEPASWAMMISGFGLVGAAVRRRKVAMSLA
ncbi:hypothetical protein GGR88_001980 [Sphingomonas jejuensis]|uniref:Ice-binding protein C-terminal domain-containing protein n=1 Tax=Sphingomonas jejuensis TaxID=904715 RepID=A0ABX0XM73_9SPHN|nr:PEPxxWA-CTERM sorting domain-containing protein [Sphingomonas jejuensis]NJC34466.1 hypothetical protein [Sphingomonas jejuensis]